MIQSLLTLFKIIAECNKIMIISFSSPIIKSSEMAGGLFVKLPENSPPTFSFPSISWMLSSKEIRRPDADLLSFAPTAGLLLAALFLFIFGRVPYGSFRFGELGMRKLGFGAIGGNCLRRPSVLVVSNDDCSSGGGGGK